MKINEHLFSLPPFISTSWKNVIALHVKDDVLIVNLIDGEAVHIPHLNQQMLELVFGMHAKFLEEDSEREMLEGAQPFGVLAFQSLKEDSELQDHPFKFSIGAMDAWGGALQHNPAQGNMANLPDEVLDKVRSISKIIAPKNPQSIPKPEPHCNCMYCQIARAINQGLGVSDFYEASEPASEHVLPAEEHELTFQQWEISQTDKESYIVTNKLDVSEKYNVFLGRPIGCTCGKDGCEHILAVLKS